MKAYFWKPSSEEEFGIAVVADNYKEAKKLGWKCWGREYGNEAEFTEQRCRLVKNCNVKGLSKGPVDDSVDGVKRGLYAYAEEAECPRCGQDGQRVMFDEGFYCSSCEGLKACVRCGELTVENNDSWCNVCKRDDYNQ